jgi:hypothetical protein
MPVRPPGRQSAALAAVATAAAVLLSPTAHAAADRQHSAAGPVRLGVPDAPPLSATAFHGVRSTAGSPAVGAPDADGGLSAPESGRELPDAGYAAAPTATAAAALLLGGTALVASVRLGRRRRRR